MTDHPDYRPADFDPPLSDDAAIMLLFVQEKKRRYARLKAEVLGIALGSFLAGLFAGVQAFRYFA